MDNEKLIRKHLNAVVLEVLRRNKFKLVPDIATIIDIPASGVGNLEIRPDYLRDLRNNLISNKEQIVKTIQGAFKREMMEFSGFNDFYVNSLIADFEKAFNDAFDPWREECRELFLEHEEIGRQIMAHSTKRLARAVGIGI